MKKFVFLFLFLFFSESFAQKEGLWEKIIENSYQNPRGYYVLERICDEAGGRVAGSLNNHKALQILIEEGKKDGLNIRLDTFRMVCWERGNDSISLIYPYYKKLRICALGYNLKTEVIESEVVFAGFGYKEDYENLSAQGKIVLVLQERAKNREELLRYEAIEIAAKQGAKAILFVNDKKGGLVLAGTGNFHGNPNAIPAFSITYEEGKSLIRLYQKGKKPRVRLQSNSFPFECESFNAVVTIKGKTNRKIVVGGHFDSWDLGQGAVDNGVGTAVLYDVARNISQLGKLDRTVEIVWFNGEELGLWGSKEYAKKYQSEVDMMINLDMPGTPRGFNAMGFDSLKVILDTLIKLFDGFGMENGVVNSPWTNSDHMYFMFEGIPSITLAGYMDESMYWHYHDFGDTFDKVNKRYISDASAVVSALVFELSKEKYKFERLTKEQVKKMLLDYRLDKRLRKQKEWNFD